MISNIRSERVNENISNKIYIYIMQNFMFVGVLVIEILEFNRKMKKKNMAKL